MNIIKCKICGKLFFEKVDGTTLSNVMYDITCCRDCNQEAISNAQNKLATSEKQK